MVIVMKQGATEADIEAVSERVRGAEGEAFVSRGAVHTIIGLVGDTARFQAIDWKQMEGVDHVIRIGKPYLGSPFDEDPGGRRTGGERSR